MWRIECSDTSHASWVVFSAFYPCYDCPSLSCRDSLSPEHPKVFLFSIGVLNIRSIMLRVLSLIPITSQWRVWPEYPSESRMYAPERVRFINDLFSAFLFGRSLLGILLMNLFLILLVSFADCCSGVATYIYVVCSRIGVSKGSMKLNKTILFLWGDPYRVLL